MAVRKTVATTWLGFLLIIAPLKLGNSASTRFTSLMPVSVDQLLRGPWTPTLAPVLAGIALLLVLIAAPQTRLSDMKPYRHLLGAFTGLVLVSLIGWLNSDSLETATSFTGHLIGVLVFSLSVIAHLHNQPQARPTLLICFAIGVGLLAYETIYQIHFGFPQMQEYLRMQQLYSGHEVSGALWFNVHQGRAMASFAISNSLAAHFLLVMPILLASIWYWCRAVEPPRLTQVLFTSFAAMILLYCFYCTKSRAAFAALTCGIGGLLVCQAAARPRTLRQQSKWLIPLVLLMAIGFYPTLRVIQGNRPAWSSVQSRQLYWQAAWQMFRENPITGIGLGDFFHSYMKLKPPGAEETRLAHSVFYHFLSQCGILGGVAAIYLLILPLLLWRQHTRGELSTAKPYLGYSLLLGMMAWSVHSLVDFNIHIPASLFCLAALPAIIFVAGDSIPERRSPQHPHKATLAILSVLAVLALAQGWKLPGEYTFRRLEEQMVNPKLASVTGIYKLAEKSSAQLPHSPHPWLRAGSFFQYWGAYDYAALAHQNACARAPKYSAAHYRLALDYFHLQRIAESEVALRKAIALYPHNPKYTELWRILQHAQNPHPRQPLNDLSP